MMIMKAVLEYYLVFTYGLIPSLLKVQGEGQMVRIWVKSANDCVETSCVDWSWFCRYSAPDLAAVSTFAICII